MVHVALRSTLHQGSRLGLVAIKVVPLPSMAAGALVFMPAELDWRHCRLGLGTVMVWSLQNQGGRGEFNE